MDRPHAHFLNLPARRSDLWEQMLQFVRAWRDLPPGPFGFDDDSLACAESNLGFPLPATLREFYGEFGLLIDGYFTDGSTSLLGASQCRLVDKFLGPLDTRTLVIGEERRGAIWGIRHDQLSSPNPAVRCVDTGGAEIDGLFSLTEFLVGLLFRATVSNAPIHIHIQSALGESEAAESLHTELLNHYPSWDRGNAEVDCGFLSHTEGEEIIAALTEEGLHVGLKCEASISALPGPLPALIGQLRRDALDDA